MDAEFKKQFTKSNYTRKEATRLLDSYQRISPEEVDLPISNALAEWFGQIEGEREDRYIAATWQSRV